MKNNFYKYGFIITFVALIIVCVMFVKVKTSIQIVCEKCAAQKVNNQIDMGCLNRKLGGVIADVENDVHYIDVREITNNPVEEWTIVKNKVGAYAIIKTEDEQAIKDIKNYFNKLNNSYQYKNIKENWHIFISDALDYDFNELNECLD